MRIVFLVLAMMLIPVLMLTACGGGGTTTAETQTTTTPPVTTTSSPPVSHPPTTSPSPTITTATVTTTTTPPTTTMTTTPPPTTTTTTPPPATTTDTVTPSPTPTPTPTPVVFTLTSSAFAYGAPIPAKYSLSGGNKSPPLSWSGAPEGTQSFALIMEDPDGGYWTHWVIFNISATVSELAEGLPYTMTITGVGTQGSNDFGTMGYGGPSPPSGTHRYYFRLYALDTTLNLTPGALKYQLVNAMQGHILGEVEYMGTYSV